MTPSEFKAIFPQFATVDDAVIQVQIDLADEYFNPCMWAGWLTEGMANFVAHKLTLNAAAATAITTPAGGIADTGTSKKVGDLQIGKSEQALLMNMKDPYMRTVYGQEYRRLAKIVGAGARAV